MVDYMFQFLPPAGGDQEGQGPDGFKVRVGPLWGSGGPTPRQKVLGVDPSACRSPCLWDVLSW